MMESNSDEIRSIDLAYESVKVIKEVVVDWTRQTILITFGITCIYAPIDFYLFNTKCINEILLHIGALEPLFILTSSLIIEIFDYILNKFDWRT